MAPTITIANNGQQQNVSIQLTNHLPAETHPDATGPATSPEVSATPHGFNTTNLHAHGLHVDPLQDNVYIALQPQLNGAGMACRPTRANPVWTCNGQFTYEYKFGQTPDNGTTRIPAGTYWYHPHKHGSVGIQVPSGMAGAFIVRGDLDVIANMPPAMDEKIMVAQLIEYTGS
jgi:FtsP/CotA-like multicopper oxidase with cupredoxin domain